VSDCFPAGALGRLLPHAGNARFVNEIVGLGASEIVCRAAVPAPSPYVDGGLFPAYLGLEIAAQAAALLEASLGLREGRPPQGGSGYLVRARGVRAVASGLPVERPLVARVRRVARSQSIGMYEAEVLEGEGVVWSGSFSVFFDEQA
jgi:predicted hotdog family 3-hydroxylacyl-ACP dehydratase